MNIDLASIFNKMKEDNLATDGMTLDSNVLFVDGLNRYMSCFAAVPSMDDNGDHIGGVVGFLKSIAAAVRQHRPTRVVIIFDGKGGSQRRRSLFPDYKMNRVGKPMTRLNRTYGFDDIQAENDSRRKQLLLLLNLLDYLPVTVMAPDNIEADDAISYLVNLNTERGNRSIIMSTDKDFLQLVSENVRVWNPMSKRLYDENRVLEEYYIHPKNFLVYRAMDGDKSDGIDGIKGTGAKTLAKLFPELATDEHIPLGRIFKESHDKIKSKVSDLIIKNWNTVERNASLMRLDDVNEHIDSSSKLKVMGKFDSHGPKLDKPGLTNELNKYKLLGSFSDYNSWIVQSWGPLANFGKSR
jgi:DNA polymerase-1